MNENHYKAENNNAFNDGINEQINLCVKIASKTEYVEIIDSLREMLDYSERKKEEKFSYA